jgi:hypothetical protein
MPHVYTQCSIVADEVYALRKREDRIGDKLADLELRGAEHTTQYHELELDFLDNENMLANTESELTILQWLANVVRHNA